MMRIFVLAGCMLASACATRTQDEAFSAALDYQFRYLYTAPVTPFFKKSRDQDGSFLYVTQRLGSTSRPQFRMPKPPGVKRIFLVGGSVAQLFDEKQLEAALRRALPAQRFEILDCGMTAYDSARDLLTVSEIVRYQPDLIVLMSGVNEGERAGPEAVRRWPRILRGLLRGTLSGHPIAAWRLTARDLAPRPLPGELAWEFEENMRTMLQEARAARIPVVLCALPWNFRDMSPRGPLPLSDKAFFDAWLRLSRGERDAAARLFARYVRERRGARDPTRLMQSAFGHYELGRALEAGEDMVGAADQYRLALMRQIPPMPMLNAALRRLSRQEGVVLADLDLAFREASPNGLVGFDFFEDDMHWERSLDPLVSAVIVRALYEASASGHLALAAAREWDRHWLDGAAKQGLHPRRDPETLRKKSWLVFRYRMWDSGLGGDPRLSERMISLMEVVHRANPELLANVRGLKEWLRGRLSQNVWDREAVAHLDVWWPALLGHVGEVYLRQGEYRQALDYFSEALRLDSGRSYVRFRKAVALAEMGRSAKAAREFRALHGFEAEYPEIRYYREALKLPPPIYGRRGGEERRTLPPAPSREREGVRALLAQAREVFGESSLLPGAAGEKVAEGRMREKEPSLVPHRPSGTSPASGGRGEPPKPKSPPKVAEPVAGPARPKPTEVSRLVDEGVRRFKVGDRLQAVRFFDRALALDPADLNALLNRGLVSAVMGDFAKALEFYDTAVRTHPSHQAWLCAALTARAEVLERLGRSEEAAADRLRCRQTIR